jgi:hypothetical protein
MGYKTANDFMDYGPAMTTAEWKAMVVLANDARDDTRVTFRPVTADEIMQRIRLSPKAWTNLRGDLVRKGFLEVVESGRKGCCAKYRIPDYPKIGHPLGDEFVSEDEMRHPGDDPFGPTDHGGVPPEDSMGHPAGDESGPFHHPAGDASLECVTQEVPPTYYPSLLEQITYETSLSPQQRASPPAVPTNEREIIREEAEAQPEEPQARPQEQRPAQQPHIDDVVDAYAKARADIGKPATRIERLRIRGGAIELNQKDHSIEYLMRLAAWMGREHPGWTDLARARTVTGSPPLIPGQRDPERESEPGTYQTYKDPPQSAYYDPKKRHRPYQNPPDESGYEGQL